MKKILVLFVFLAVLSPAVVKAGNASCYNTEELEAEMLVRLHSELMVVTLACRTSSTGAPLPPSYTNFTRKYLQWIKNSEARLIAWFRRNGSKSPLARLDRLRTDMGNAYSQEIADLSPAGFCKKYRDSAMLAGAWNESDIKNRLTLLIAAYPSRAPLCGSSKLAAGRVE